MKKAYVYNNGEYEEVIIANSIDEAKAAVNNDNATFIIEPVRAYNTPDSMGIVIATSINDIRTNEGTNSEYWNAIDSIIEKHISKCIKELKNWSTSNVNFRDGNLSENSVIFEISKEIGDVILEKMKDWGKADFPVIED